MLSVQTTSMLIMFGVVGGVLGTMIIGFPFLKRKGVDVSKVLNTADQVINVSDEAIKAADAILPGNKAIDILKTIEKWASIAVGQAQQLYHAGTIKTDERKQVAQDAVYKILQELNIELTDARKDLINVAIENAVNDLGHKDKTDVEKQAQLEKVQSEKAKLEEQNTQLNEKIAQVQSMVGLSQVNQ